MSCGKLLIQQVIDLVIIDLEVAALDDENALLIILTIIDLMEKLLKAVNQDTLVRHPLNRWGCASIPCRASLIYIR